MGLDAYIYAVPGDVEKIEECEDKDELAYFRKHASLHGYLTDLAIERGVVENRDDFNCVYLELTETDLIEIMEGAKDGQPPKPTDDRGFFWGRSHPEDWRRLMDVCGLGLAAIRRGERVFYWSWW